ncbi:MAG: sulfate adenylyltransferase [Deltaproteobacteria bacterium]|nr:sulfate adenylyltransferase [Deltaproteobacteria bacterium]MCH7913950.1 sulfate adenylyltransferase [Deltaproteobacteria bacterium]
MALVNPHGKEKKLKPLLLTGDQFREEKQKAKSLPQVMLTSRETSDLIMLGIGAFTPLDGFMTKEDWKGVCDDYRTSQGIFWPVPITLSVPREQADRLKDGQEVALTDEETDELMGSMTVQEKYTIDKTYECKQVFKTTDTQHPGVAKLMAQGEVNLAGTVKVFSESYYPELYKDVYLRPAQTREIFQNKGWNTVAALQLRNPMHRSHEYLAKVAIEICDGVLIHQLIGKLKPGDIPAEVRVRAVNALVENYFVKDTCIQAGYPMEMRYAGPREALLHAVFRQNYGCSHLIVGRDHAGVGEYYGPFDAHRIFDEIPKDSLELQPLKMDWTFYCYKCNGVASIRTCPHCKEDRLLLSGTMLRRMLSGEEEVPDHFSRPEVLTILKDYYAKLDEKVEVKLHKYAEGEK